MSARNRFRPWFRQPPEHQPGLVELRTPGDGRDAFVRLTAERMNRRYEQNKRFWDTLAEVVLGTEGGP